MIKAVIFDWDGTLADTMHYHFLSYKKALKNIFNVKPIDLYLREGGRSIDILPDMLKSKNLSREEIEKIIEKKREYFIELDPKIEMKHEASKIIKSLRNQGFKIGLVTGSRRVTIQRFLKPDEERLFDYILTGTETKNPKPDPEPYQSCLKTLKVKPGEAVVIENAPLGIESAKSAGTICIAITSTLSERYLKKADFIVKNLGEIGGIIKNL